MRALMFLRFVMACINALIFVAAVTLGTGIVALAKVLFGPDAAVTMAGAEHLSDREVTAQAAIDQLRAVL